MIGCICPLSTTEIERGSITMARSKKSLEELESEVTAKPSDSVRLGCQEIFFDINSQYNSDGVEFGSLFDYQSGLTRSSRYRP